MKNRLKEIFKEKKRTYSDLAVYMTALGIPTSRQSVWMWAKGTNPRGEDKEHAIALFFGLKDEKDIYQ